MSIECHSSNVCSDVRCTICGQGFLVYSGPAGRHHLGAIREDVQRELRHHHEQGMHPAGMFNVETHAITAEHAIAC